MLRDVAGEESAPGEPVGIRKILDSIRRIVHALRVSSRAAERDARGERRPALRPAAARRASSTLLVNEIAARTRTHQSTVSGVVRRTSSTTGCSSAKGSPLETDRRRVELGLTRAGKTPGAPPRTPGPRSWSSSKAWRRQSRS